MKSALSLIQGAQGERVDRASTCRVGIVPGFSGHVNFALRVTKVLPRGELGSNTTPIQ